VPEREQRLDVPLVEPPIPDIDAFFVRDAAGSRQDSAIRRRIRTIASETSPAACQTGSARRRGHLDGVSASCPPYQASTTAGTRPIHFVMVTGAPATITTMVFWLAAATASINSS